MNKFLLKIIGIIFFGVTLPIFIKEGMFVDGLFYSTISRNLYLGKGSFLNNYPIKVSECEKMKDSLLATGFPYCRFDGGEETPSKWNIKNAYMALLILYI